MGLIPEAIQIPAPSTNAFASFFSSAIRSNASSAVSDGSHGVFSKVNGSDVVLMLLTLSVFLRVINFHWSKLPGSVAMALGSILCTGGLLLLRGFPGLGIRYALENFTEFLREFPDLVLHYMLGFLLFAAAIEVDLRNLSRIWTTVLALSVVSTAISTLIVSVLTYLLMQSISQMDFAWCLLFGAIVSPTDPVTVISIVNEKPELLPASTKYFVLGESLLNDAVGVVLYLVFTEIVQKPDIRSGEVISLLLSTVVVECLAGAIIGVVLAWLAYSAIRSVEDVFLEVMITFVLVGNINFICRLCHASIPLASVFAGLFVGNYGAAFAMNEEHVKYFKEIWKLTDETLNSVLFLMIGAAELFWNPQDIGGIRVLILIIAIICISLFARAVSVALPLLSIVFLEWLTGRRFRHPAVKYRGGTLAVLTWAGMRGGISIALALGVPDAFVRHAVPGHMANGQLIFFMTFTLVVFSIIVQGLYFEPVVRMINRVSYQIMPTIGTSGGLGTYVSAIDLQDPGNQHVGEFDGDLPNGFNGSDDEFRASHSWLQAPGCEDDSNLAPIEQLENNNGTLYSDVVRPHVTDSTDIAELEQPMRATLPAMLRLARDRRRQQQGSDTFRHLPVLQELPTIPKFFSGLRQHGTQTIRDLLDLRVGGQSSLTRSKTTPEGLRLAVESDTGKDEMHGLGVADAFASSDDNIGASTSSAEPLVSRAMKRPGITRSKSVHYSMER